ncbi:MAG: GAF domain-containing protein [bacterium]
MTEIITKQNSEVGPVSALFTERLSALNVISYQLSYLHERESILQCALHDGPSVVGADSANIWLWDTDQHAPVLRVTTAGHSSEFSLPDALKDYLNNACSGTITEITAETTDDIWPADMAGCSVAFIPLPDQQGCLGVYTVQRRRGAGFSKEELLLLSSLSNAIASALRNAQLFANERGLLRLLHNSIRHVVQATSSTQGDNAEVIMVLLQVAEAMTHARATCVALQIEESNDPIIVTSGPLATSNNEELRAATLEIWQQHGTEIPTANSCAEVFTDAYSFCRSSYFTGAKILLGNKPAGIIFAVGDNPFEKEQLASLRTIGDQIGVAINHRLQMASNSWMLLQMSNLNYVSNAITDSFDPIEILKEISSAVAQAMKVPVAFCSELQDDGTLSVQPGSTIGLTEDFAREMHLTRHNAVIRTVLDMGSSVTSRQQGATSGFPTLATLNLVDWACVPMVVTRSSAFGRGSPVRGVLLVGDTQAHLFSDREIALISTYANQAALALENTHLYAQLDRQLHQMELLYHMTHSISTLDLATIYQQVALTAVEGLHISAVVLCMMDEQNGIQQVVATHGEGLEQYVGEDVQPGIGLIGMVAKRGIPISSVNVRSDGRSILLRKIANENGLSSAITVPLIIGGNNLGTLSVLSQDTREFSADELQLLQSIAADAALAIQNARRYTMERERNHAMRERLVELNQYRDKEVKWLERLLEIEYEKYAEDGVFRRMLVHIRAISAIADDDITGDNKVDIARMAQQRISELRASSPELWPFVNINGTHPRLSMIQATALMMLISEYILAMTIVPGKVNTLDITFQQSGNEVMLTLTDDLPETTGVIEINPAIIALVGRELTKLTVKPGESRGRPYLQLRFSLY